MPSFRDEHILIIAPGSSVTLAQLGLPESFTPAKVRVPSRMFPGLDPDTWLATKIQELQHGETMIIGDQQEVIKAGVKKKKGRPPKRKKGQDGENKDKKGGESESGVTSAAKDASAMDVTATTAEPKDATTKASNGMTGDAAAAPKEGEKEGESVLKVESPAVAPKVETPGPGVDKSLPTSTGADAAKEVSAKGDTTMTDADANAGEDEGDGDDNEDEEAADEDIDDTLNDAEEDGEEEKYYYEDDDDEEGAVWCMKEGRIVDWGCFFGLLNHVYEVINPTFHTPVMIISQPCWTMSDKERICQFVFEKLKSPGFALMDSATAACWAYGVPTATVIDVGYEKTDITPVVEHVVQELARTTIPFGGNSMNLHLHKLLPHFTEDEIEQLKYSSICEILPPGIPIPGEKPPTPKDDPMNADGMTVGMGTKPIMPKEPGEEGDEDGVMNVAEIVASGKTQEYLAQKEKEKAAKKAGQQAPVEKRLPNWKKEKNTFTYFEKSADEIYQEEEDRMDVDGGEANKADGDHPMGETSEAAKPDEPSTVAQITTTDELKPAADDKPAEPAAQKTDAPGEAMDVSTDAPAAPAADASTKTATAEAGSETKDQPTETVTSPMQTDKPEGTTTTEAKADDTGSGEAAPTETTTAANGSLAPPPEGGDQSGKTPEANMSVFPTAAEMEDEDRRRGERAAARKEEKKRLRDADLAPGVRRKELEVGVERFKAAEGGILYAISDAVYRSICKVDELGKRSDCWDNLLIIGNGTKLRGFREALISTLNTKYLVSPVSSTIFTSELPSNISTPIGTGANTPAHHLPNTPGPSIGGPSQLLTQAVANAAAARDQQQHPQLQTPQPPQQTQHHSSSSSSHHSQTPTSIKISRIPEYFPEWKDAGFEECSFLGAQVAAKILFVIDQGMSKGFLSRVEYNDRGPKAVHSI